MNQHKNVNKLSPNDRLSQHQDVKRVQGYSGSSIIKLAPRLHSRVCVLKNEEDMFECQNTVLLPVLHFDCGAAEPFLPTLFKSGPVFCSLAARSS